MKKVLSLFVASAILALSLAACGGTASSAPTSSVGTTTTPAAANSTVPENVEIRFSWWGSEARHEATLAAIAAYEAANPHVKIVPEYSGYDGYQDKLMAQVAGGNAPDIFTCVAEWYPALYDSNALADLTGKMDFSGHSESIMEACSYDGKVMGVNASLNGYGITYNKVLTEKYGVEVPTGDYTWDDLAKMLGEAYEKSGGEVYGTSDMRYGGWLMEAFGYTQLQKPWPYMWSNDTLTITAEDVTAFFNYVENLPEGSMLPPEESYNIDQFTSAAVAQGIAMFEFGSLGTFSAIQSQTENELGVLLLPVGPKGETANTSRPGLILSVFQGSKVQDESAKFLDWFTNSADAAKILKTCRGVPPTTTQRDAVMAEAGLLEKSDLVIIEAIDKIFQGETQVFLPGPLGADQVRQDIFKGVCQEVAFGKLTPEEGGEKFMQEALKALER